VAAQDTAIVNANQHVLASVEEQIRELQPALQKQVEIASIAAELAWLQQKLQNVIAGFSDSGLDDAIQLVNEIKAGQKNLSDFGNVLVDLYALQQTLDNRLQGLVDTMQITNYDKDNLESMVLDAIIQVRQLLNSRPDVSAVMDDLTALKNLRGGPADATAFHDFHVLEMAFESIWLHAFDENLKTNVQDLYAQAVRLYADLGLNIPDFDAVNDINDLNKFLNEVKKVIDPEFAGSVLPPVPGSVIRVFPEAVTVWYLFSEIQMIQLTSWADSYESHNGDKEILDEAKRWLAEAMKNPQGNVSRLTRLLSEIGKSLSEPYAFDVFAPDSYNFGLMITYRQKWEPGAYQAGDLVSTIPLAPGESRKFTKKRIVKTSRAEKELEKSMSSRSSQSSEISRAETEIMQKVTTATNFKMTAHGSFNISIGSIDATTEFMANQEQQSALNKKAFHEATLKAAEEYKLERSLEIDTTTAVETEETTSGEISNPNNEITVTYLFYELQRRFKIHEFLYRVRPVILVAQDVPAPHEINEAWLIQYQWIISRVLLDDSLRPALYYLTTGFAGDEASISIIKAHWEAQAGLVRDLEGQVKSQLVMRNVFRGQLEGQQIAKARADADQATAGVDIARDLLTGGGFVGLLTGGLSTLFTANNDASNLEGAVANAAMAEATRKAAETRLQYAEQALADAQDKLKEATSAFEQATKDYAAALQNQYSRHVIIDQLRVHIKQNILYYMQAIWDHEPPDQRFFRLYNKLVACPKPDQYCSPTYDQRASSQANSTNYFTGDETFGMNVIACPPVSNDTTQLAEIADLDNPLGYKGNYIIFPMKGDCYLTQYMLSEFIDDYLGVIDPDGGDNFDAESFDLEWKKAAAIQSQSARDARLNELKADLANYITAIRRSTDEIIVPTGQLFIEALPGSHPLLEDFKLLHRLEDVRKVKSEVRHAELEDLRLAARVIGGQEKPELLEDPDVERKVIISGNGQSPVVISP
jgi:hypothetical protein